jgi:hypothetical protein
MGEHFAPNNSIKGILAYGENTGEGGRRSNRGQLKVTFPDRNRTDKS